MNFNEIPSSAEEPQEEIQPEKIIADFEAILQKLLDSNSLNMRDLVILRRTIGNRQMPDEASLSLFPEVAEDIAKLKEKAEKLGESIPWSELKQAIARAQTKY